MANDFPTRSKTTCLLQETVPRGTDVVLVVLQNFHQCGTALAVLLEKVESVIFRRVQRICGIRQYDPTMPGALATPLETYLEISGPPPSPS